MGTPSTQHATYAALYRLNDPLFLQDVLLDDVVLRTYDGCVLHGATNVLAYLVGPGMTEWSQLVHAVDAITHVAPLATKTRYITKVGYVKDVLFEEVITWNDDLLVASIVHTSSHSHRPRTLSRRLSASAHSAQQSIDSLVDTFVASSTASSRRSSSSSSSVYPTAPCCFELSHASVTDLSVVKPHRPIHAYLLIKEFPSGKVLHRSMVMKHERAPQWPTPITVACSRGFRRLDISVVHTSLVYTKHLGMVSIDASVLPSKVREQYDFMGSIVGDPENAPDLFLTFHRCDSKHDAGSLDRLYAPSDLVTPRPNLAAPAADAPPPTIHYPLPIDAAKGELVCHMLQAVSLSLLCVLGMVLIEYSTVSS
ncbi:hypothetical protein SPRG_03699 [Saprolegnia parasitica CBS 223.65]|uniref:C2 domain-containing protein n=1 Tax=Saprolegnia parasitica (strain CBS 223.65) TaxID=695850 RepID=A0A067CM74_SAPPC|nr:hypothetical protein SPRG_03699 [Saprolegnia parasitica CBS 223.65]KDO31779.1 hypothetical protein SPRG_03699 [Saprolegnia parasitica CBS 223.65]|eukprot:XP_012197659.1 hypothetical protein SPRG_03699 [Saprolegnia parasitica CBS 223.65]